MTEVNITNECLERCNSMRHLETVEQRVAFAQQCAVSGLTMVCRGPIPGQIHPICRLPEETKQQTEKIVQPLMRLRQVQAALPDVTNLSHSVTDRYNSEYYE